MQKTTTFFKWIPVCRFSFSAVCWLTKKLLFSTRSWISIQKILWFSYVFYFLCTNNTWLYPFALLDILTLDLRCDHIIILLHCKKKRNHFLMSQCLLMIVVKVLFCVCECVNVTWMKLKEDCKVNGFDMLCTEYIHSKTITF